MLVEVFIEETEYALDDTMIKELTKALKEKLYVWKNKENANISHISTAIMYGPLVGQKSKIVWTVFWTKDGIQDI